MSINRIQMKLLIALFALLITNCSYAQNFWNNSFEYEATNGLPRKWSIEIDGGNAKAHLTTEVSKHGEKSLKVNIQESEFYILQSVRFTSKRGKLQFSANVKVKENNSLNFSLLVLDKFNESSYSSKPDKFENSVWNTLFLEEEGFNIEESTNLLIALKVTGSGVFWVDDFNFYIDEEAYGRGAIDFRDPTKEEISKLNEYAHPIYLDKQSDFSGLNNVLKDIKIVGLGENSHGSSTIFKTKLQLVKYLAKEQGFSVFALESPAVEADYINEYVLHNKGTKEGVIENLAYPSWQNQEVLDIIKWMKTYNLTAKNKISFKGFDMQNPRLAFRRLMKFGELKKDKNINALLLEIKELYKKDKKTVKEWEDLLSKGLSLSSAVQEYSKLEEDKMYHYYADILYQSFSLATPGNRKSRDAFMADNIRSLQSKCNCKVIVSGDNDHLRKTDAKAGYYLKEFLKDIYLSIGFTFNTGTYSAYGKKEFYPVDASYSGTYEYLFSKSKHRNYFLNLLEIKDIPLLNSKSGFRIIGSRPQENGQFFEMDIKSNFDIIFYLDASMHTIQNK